MNYDFFRNKLLRKALAGWCAFATLATTCGPAWAAVATGDYLGGAANLNGASSGVSNYGTQTATYAGFTAAGGAGVLDWNKLNVPGSTTMEFNNGTFYNVVNSAGGMSTIAGAINGTQAANVYIFNPNGILFNSGSSVDVGGVFGALATGVSGAALTSWMANPGAVPAAIKDATMQDDVTVEGGTFKASQLAFAGRNVAIKGGTFNGATALAAGTKVTIDGFGGGTITMTVPDTAAEGDVDMLGEFADNLAVKAAGDTTVANGKLTVGGNLTVESTDGDGVFRGGLNVNNAVIDVKGSGGVDVNVAGDVWVEGKTDFKTTGGSVSLVSRAAQANVLGTVGGEAATIRATGGNLTIQAAQGIKIGANGVVQATEGTDKGGVTLLSTGKDSLSGDGIQIAGAGAKVSADNGITFRTQDGNVTIKEGAEVTAASETKTLTIEATKGAISGDATSKLTGKGVTALTAAATEDITLEGSGNDLAGDVSITSAKDVKIVNNTDLKIRSAAADSLDLRVTDTDTMSVKATGDTAEQTITVQKIVAQKSDGSVRAVFEQTADGTITVTGADGIMAKTVRQTGAGTIRADKIAGDVEQTGAGAAKLQANTAANGLTITGALAQNDTAATVGTDSEAVTVGGFLTQDGGTLNANALVLKGGAGQGEQGKIAATTVDLQGESNDFTLLGGANAIGKIGTSLPGGVQNVRVKNASALEIGTAKASGNFLAETENGSITVDGSKVAAGKALIVTAGGGVDLRKAAEVSGENIRLEAKGAGRDATVAKGVTVSAAKNLTVVAEHDVNANGLLETKDGSVYAKAGNDVNLGEGQVIRARGTDGNVLLEAGRDIAGVGGQEAVVSAEDSGSSDGYVSLAAGRDAGANVRIDGKKASTRIKGDATLNLHGDVEVTLEADGNVTVNHTDGTLSVVKGGASGVDAKVNEVVDAETLAVHKLSDKAGSGEGLVGKNVTVRGTDGSSLDVVSVLRASETADVSVDGDAVVHGRLEAGKDAKVVAGRDVSVADSATAEGTDGNIDLTAGGDVAVNGAVTAGGNANLTAGRDVAVGGAVRSGNDSVLKAGQDVGVFGQVDARRTAQISAGRNVGVGGSVAANRDAVVSAGRDVDVSGTVSAGRTERVNSGRDTTVSGTLQAGEDLGIVARGNLATPGSGKLVAGRDLYVDVGTSTPQINIAVGKGVSARSGERAIAFRTVGGYAYPEVYGNGSETAVFIDGRVAGGNSADFAILQGYEQAAIFGNVLLTPVFTRAANFFPLTSFTDMQAPGASFTQGYLFASEKGELTEEADEPEAPEVSEAESAEGSVQTAGL